MGKRAASSVRLGRKTVAGLPIPAEGSAFHWDSDLPGFGILIRASGARTWVVQYRAGAGDRRAPTRRVTLGNASALNPDEARSAAKALLASVALGRDPAAERAADRKAETVAEVAERWLTEHVRLKRKPRTEEFYRTGLNRHVLPRIGKLAAAAVTRQLVMRLHGEIATRTVVPEAPGSRRPKERAVGGPITANRAVAGLSAMFTWAAKAGLVPEGFNPARGVERFREQPGERYLSGEELARLGEALRLAETTGIPWREQDESKPTAKNTRKAAGRVEVFGPHTAGAVRLLLLTGMRLREVLHLEWAFYDRDRGVLRLPDSKTGRKTVVLGAAAVAVLEGIPRVGRYVIASTSAGLADEQPRRDINRAWAAIRRHAGLDDVRLHDLRHSFAAIGAGSGASLPQIGKLLGHSQPATTARYAHLGATAERRVADQIGAEIASALGLPGAEVFSLDDRRRA